MSTALPKYGTTDGDDINLLENQQSNGESQQNSVSKLITAFASMAIVIDQRNSPPGSESELDIYRVGDTPAGDWSAFDEDDLAVFIDGAYHEWDPIEGVSIYQKDLDTVLTFDGTSWFERLSSVNSGIVAAGSTQGAATQLTARNNVVETSVATSADGVKLPSARAGMEVFVYNRTGTTVQLWPFSGDNIEGTGVDAEKQIPDNQLTAFIAKDATNWVGSRASWT